MRSQVRDRRRVAALQARGLCVVVPGYGRVAAEERTTYGEVGPDQTGGEFAPDQLIERLAGAVDALLAADLDEASDDALGARIGTLYKAVQQLEGERLRCMAEFDQRKAWLGQGARSAKGWLADTCGLGIGEAAGEVETARQLERLPGTSAALASGDLSLRKARVLTRAAKQLRGKGDDELDALAASAGASDIPTLRAAADKIIDDVDADAMRRGEHDAYARRRVTERRLADGSSAGEYRLDPIDAEAWRTALNALSRPDGPNDDRSHEQRMADAMAKLAWLALDHGDLPTVGGERPHVSVLFPADDAEPAELDFTGSVSDEAARMLSCDASIRRVLVRGKSEVLDVGRASRNPTAAQRRAVIARDRRCVGCGAPAGWCEVHHVHHWRDGGPTDLCNLALVCRRCHRKVHFEGWTMRLDAEGRWEFMAPARHPTRRHRQLVRQRAATPATVTGIASERRSA